MRVVREPNDVVVNFEELGVGDVFEYTKSLQPRRKCKSKDDEEVEWDCKDKKEYGTMTFTCMKIVEAGIDPDINAVVLWPEERIGMTLFINYLHKVILLDAEMRIKKPDGKYSNVITQESEE